MPADRSAAGSGSIARLLARDASARGFSNLARDLLAPVPGWIAQEVEHRRLFLWLPVAIGLGVVLYFAAEAEPSWIAPLVGTGLFTGAALWLRSRRRLAFTAAVGVACVFAGFAAGSLRTWLVAAPVLDRPRVLRLTAFVESIDKRVEGARMVLRPLAAEGLAESELPLRVRVVVPRPGGLKAGDTIAATARLLPPPVPSRPDGYNFARDAYFNGLGAVGSIAGRIELVPGRPMSLDARWYAAVDRARNALTDRIALTIGGAAGGVAAALITGKRGLIPEEVNEDLRAAGIYHVVSISGLHMVLAAGMVFWLVRALLALWPAAALALPIKKIAAGAAMAAGCAYTVFAGGDVATVRSLMMTIVLLGAVLVDRPALSMRNLALAAILTLLFEPETLLSPGFQMSFAAVAALIAVFERGGVPAGEGGAIPGIPDDRPAPAKPLKRGLVGRLWDGLRRHAVGTVLSTAVAEGATATYTLYHFQRLTVLGLVGNMTTLPIVSLVIMPAALIGVIAYPFGLDGPVWAAMGLGVRAMLAVSAWIGALPWAQRAVPAFDLSAMLALTLALLWLALWRTPLRYAGIPVAALGLALAARSTPPDIVAAQDARSLAIRGPDGRMVLVGRQSGDFTASQWLRADGDMRAPQEARREGGAACDPLGCVVRLPDGRAVSQVLAPAAFGEDCRRAAVVISPLSAPKWCGAPLVLDREHFRKHGATAVLAEAGGFALRTDRTALQNRPWLPKGPKPRPDPAVTPGTPGGSPSTPIAGPEAVRSTVTPKPKGSVPSTRTPGQPAASTRTPPVQPEPEEEEPQ